MGDAMRICFVGLGTMGPGMAATLARGGLTVRAFDTEAAQLEKAPGAAAMALGAVRLNWGRNGTS